MAAFIVGCGTLLAGKVSDKRRQKKALQLQEEDDFETLKASNQRRAEYLSKSNKSYSEPTPPSYEHAVSQQNSRQGSDSSYSTDTTSNHASQPRA
ncbi:hypothetical protein K402DRAFT_398480 [Aulographum hederae CBS 113979]|uniref:Uncharacterized protein n=1 Tax=Aulographum hederae CBS 113979 TaxID=1176131 RepID=A0A6G1GL65_9PEZI|nr:hypothetical protein K402DRAFT_398480 [Aulographum hederae CBS 113979]